MKAEVHAYFSYVFLMTKVDENLTSHAPSLRHSGGSSVGVGRLNTPVRGVSVRAAVRFVSRSDLRANQAADANAS